MSTVDAVGQTGQWTSMVVDGSGALHVSYYDVTNQDVKYAHRSPAGSWTLATPEATGSVGQYSSIALDAMGGIYIAYLDATIDTVAHDDLRVAYSATGASWSAALAEDRAQSVGSYTATAVDLDGIVHVLHRDQSTGFARHQYRAP